jgi:hypothetical protein
VHVNQKMQKKKTYKPAFFSANLHFATETSLAGLITIITVIPGLVFGIIYWLFAWLIAGRAADSEGAWVRANSTTESGSSASAWAAWFANDVVPRN